MTDPIELINKTTGKLAAFACGKCHVVASSPKMYLGTPEETENAAREAARAHCGPWFCECGAERPQFWESCRACTNRRLAVEGAERDKAVFDAAEKIRAEDWNGEYLWDDGSEAIYGHPDEVLDYYDGDLREPPTHVWDCDEHKLRIDAAEVLYRGLEAAEFHDGAADHVSAKLVRELQSVLDWWCEKAAVTCWKPNGRAVLLPTREDEEES